MTTIESPDSLILPLLPILQVGEEPPLLEAFFGLRAATAAAVSRPAHVLIDSGGRLLSVRIRPPLPPLLSIAIAPPPPDALLARVRGALEQAAKQADQASILGACFGSEQEFDDYVRALLENPSLVEVVGRLCADLDPTNVCASDDPPGVLAAGTDPDPEPDPDAQLRRRRLCKVMRTC